MHRLAADAQLLADVGQRPVGVGGAQAAGGVGPVPSGAWRRWPSAGGGRRPHPIAAAVGAAAGGPVIQAGQQVAGAGGRQAAPPQLLDDAQAGGTGGGQQGLPAPLRGPPGRAALLPGQRSSRAATTPAGRGAPPIPPRQFGGQGMPGQGPAGQRPEGGLTIAEIPVAAMNTCSAAVGARTAASLP